MDGMGAADVGNAGLGKTEKSYLTLLDEITDRTGDQFSWPAFLPLRLHT